MVDVEQGVEGASSPEFLAYRVLYQTVHAREGETSSLLAALRLVTSEVPPHDTLAHLFPFVTVNWPLGQSSCYAMKINEGSR